MTTPTVARRPVPIGALLLLFVLSGAAGLIYEVVWARQLVLVFGNTSQAVSTILTGFFGGLAIGGFFGGRIADRVVRPLRLYGALELVVVIVVLITPITFRLIGTIYQGIYPSLAESPILLALVRFVLAILALAPATLLMGATLPTLTRFLTKGGAGIAGAFQKLYAANTLGAIFGTAIAGFVLIELFGLTGALIVGAVCSGTAGLIALLLDRRSGAAAVNPAPDPEPHPRVVGHDPLPDRGRRPPASPRVPARVRLGPHGARLPGGLEPAHRRRDRQLDLRVHDHPDAVPHRHRARRGDARRPAPSRALDDRADRRRADR